MPVLHQASWFNMLIVDMPALSHVALRPARLVDIASIMSISGREVSVAFIDPDRDFHDPD